MPWRHSAISCTLALNSCVRGGLFASHKYEVPSFRGLACLSRAGNKGAVMQTEKKAFRYRFLMSLFVIFGSRGQFSDCRSKGWWSFWWCGCVNCRVSQTRSFTGRHAAVCCGFPARLSLLDFVDTLLMRTSRAARFLGRAGRASPAGRDGHSLGRGLKRMLSRWC